MKKTLLTAILTLTLFTLNPITSHATTLEGPAPHFANDDDISINTEINGDTFLVGQNISVTKPINGDLYLVGKNVVIDAPVNGNIHAIAENIEIKSQVSGSFSFIAEKVLIPSIGEIGTDAYGLASEFNLYGRIGRDLNLGYSEDSNILVDGNVVGNIHYLNTIPTLTNKAFLGGKLVKTDTKDTSMSDNEMRFQIILSKILHSLSLIFVIILATRLIPKKLLRGLELYKNNLRQNSLFGLLSLVVFPLILLALTLSVVGIPVALISTSILIFVIYASPIYPAIWVGQKLLPQSKSILIQSICGIFIFDVVSMGPIIGTLLYTFSVVTFLGLVLKILLGLRSIKVSK